MKGFFKQDYFGDWYFIPSKKKETFEEMNEKISKKHPFGFYELCEEFNEIFEPFRMKDGIEEIEINLNFSKL